MCDKDVYEDVTEDEEEAARKARHDERVAAIAERIADLVAKGEQVMASLEARADAADAAFGQRASATDERVGSFAAAMQARVEKAMDQFAQDLDVISRTIDERMQADEAAAEEAPCEVEDETAEATEDAEPDEE